MVRAGDGRVKRGGADLCDADAAGRVDEVKKGGNGGGIAAAPPNVRLVIGAAHDGLRAGAVGGEQ